MCLKEGISIDVKFLIRVWNCEIGLLRKHCIIRSEFISTHCKRILRGLLFFCGESNKLAFWEYGSYRYRQRSMFFKLFFEEKLIHYEQIVKCKGFLLFLLFRNKKSIDYQSTKVALANFDSKKSKYICIRFANIL